MEPALCRFIDSMKNDGDQPPGECCNPCWDNCRLTDEVRRDKKNIDNLDKDIKDNSGKIVKIQKDLVDLNNNLTNEIGYMEKKHEYDINLLNSRVDQEIQDRIADVDAEEARAKDAESTLDAKIDQEIADRIVDVNEEEARAKAAEHDLSDALAAEISRATAAENSVAGDLAAEITRSTNKDAEIAGNLASEITRATGAEQTIAGNLASEVTRATNSEQTIAGNLAAEIANRRADAVASVDYDSSQEKIIFKNYEGATIDYIDANVFVKDGMVRQVAISNGNLVITWNSDAELVPTTIPLTDIFNPNNYYTKTEIDGKVSTINQSIATETNRATLAEQGVAADLTTHTTNQTIHITAAERSTWNAKQNALTFDNAPTANSSNPVTSQGILSAINNAVAAEAALRDAADDVLDDAIDDEAAARATEDTRLAGLISTANTNITNIQTTIGQTSNNNTTLAYGQTKNIAKVNGVDISVGLPAAPTGVTNDGNGNNIAATYVTAVGTSGDNVTWTKNGIANNITVPYATKAQKDQNGDVIDTTYLKSATAASTYLTQANASSTYLTQTNAASTYLTQTNASNTYETQTHAANTYSTKANTVMDVVQENDHLLIKMADGTSHICALPSSSVYVIGLENRIAALEAMWQANSTTNTLSPKSPYVNVSMSGNLTVGGTSTAAGFYDSTISAS